MTKLVRCGINFYADVDNKKAVNDRDALQNTKLMEHYTHLLGQLQYEYNPQIQISVVSGTKRSIFRQKNKTKRSKKRLHTTLIKPEQKVNEDLCSGFIVS